MPAWITSLLRDEMPVPIAAAASATITSCPDIAARRATASPTTPAPTTKTCIQQTETPRFDSGDCLYAGALFRRDPHLGRRRLDVGIDVGFVFDEVLLEHAHELARGLIEGRFVLPGLHRIEQMRLDAGHRGRHREAEIRIGAEARVLERAVERSGHQRACRLDRHGAAQPPRAAGP